MLMKSTTAQVSQAAVLVAWSDTAERNLFAHLRWSALLVIVPEQACNGKAAVHIKSVLLNGGNTDREPICFHD